MQRCRPYENPTRSSNPKERIQLNVKMHPSSWQLVIFIFANNGVNFALTHEEGKCLSVS